MLIHNYLILRSEASVLMKSISRYKKARPVVKEAPNNNFAPKVWVTPLGDCLVLPTYEIKGKKKEDYILNELQIPFLISYFICLIFFGNNL